MNRWHHLVKPQDQERVRSLYHRAFNELMISLNEDQDVALIHTICSVEKLADREFGASSFLYNTGFTTVDGWYLMCMDIHEDLGYTITEEAALYYLPSLLRLKLFPGSTLSSATQFISHE